MSGPEIHIPALPSACADRARADAQRQLAKLTPTERICLALRLGARDRLLQQRLASTASLGL